MKATVRQRRPLLIAGVALLMALTSQVSAASAHVPVAPSGPSVFGADARPVAQPSDDASRGLVHRGLVADKAGACVGGLRVTAVNPVMCTHGPDAPPNGLGVKSPVAAAPATVAAAVAALLLTRVAERGTGQTWRNINRQLGRITQVTLAGPAGTVTQTTPLNQDQKAIYQALSVQPPPRVTTFNPT